MRFLRLTLALSLAFAPLQAWAAVTATPVFAQTPKLARIVSATAQGAYVLTAGGNVTNTVTLYTCGTNGSKVMSLSVSSTDTSARDVTLFLVSSSVAYPITTVTIPIGAGTVAGTPPVNLLSSTNTPGLPVDSDGNPFLFCTSSSDAFALGNVTGLTAGKVTYAVAVVADF